MSKTLDPISHPAGTTLLVEAPYSLSCIGITPVEWTIERWTPGGNLKVTSGERTWWIVALEASRTKVVEVLTLGPVFDKDGRRGDYIQLFSGGRFYPFDPRIEEIHIEDIAHSLARIARFNGHTKGDHAMSVAQHSVNVSFYCNQDEALEGLLHDASDMAFGDIPRPLKYMPEFAVIREAEKKCQAVIYERFGLRTDKLHSVHVADNAALTAEARDLMTPDDDIWGKWVNEWTPMPETVEPWAATRAEERFLHRFKELTTKHIGLRK